MAIRNRFIFWGLLGLVLIAALVFAFWPRAIAADLAVVSQGRMSVTINEEGETRVKDVFIVSAPLAGDMERITLEPGDPVISGKTKLAIIHPLAPPTLDQRTQAQQQAAVQTARSSINMAEADIERLTTDYTYLIHERDRLRPLLDRGFVSNAAFDKAQAAVNSAAASLHSAEAGLRMRRSELQMARAALMPRLHSTSGIEHIDLTAVIDGVVLHLIRESEGPIAQGEPILEIGDPKDIEIVVDLLSEDAVRISLGDPVIISGWGGEDLSGRVRLIEPFAFTKVSALGIEEQRANVIINFDNEISPQTLGHGYRADLAIITWQQDDVLTVPMTALFKQGNDWTVFAVKEGRASLQTVEIGQMNGRHAEVLKGLMEDDQVIEHPSARIEHGIKVYDRGT